MVKIISPPVPPQYFTEEVWQISFKP